MIKRSIATSILFAVIISSVLEAAQVCKARLDCPLNYRTDTVKVGSDVVALSKTFSHCAPDSVDEGISFGKADTISVFFIIDHSGSMSYMDSTGIRYHIVQNVIDSLYANSPASEVGIAVFSNQLLHSYSDDPFFTQLDSRWHDSYVPLTRLDATIDGVSAVEKLKWAIEISSNPNDTDIGGNLRLVNGNYSPTGRFDSRVTEFDWNNGYNGTTDISLAFEAARKAFLTAAYPKENQYVVFLSDGVHQYVDREREQYQLDYIQGLDIPTTFTAYFVNVNKSIPEQILTMTENIRNNGYSSKNNNSTVWKSMGSESELFTKLLGQLSIGSGMKYYTSYPLSISINGISTVNFDDSLAFLPRDIPLTGPVTELNISYKFHWNDPMNKDSTSTFTTVVVQSQSPDLLALECWDQGSLKFFYQNTEITSIAEDQRTIEVRFYPPAELELTEAIIVVKNASGTDSLTLVATNQGMYFSAPFTREYGNPRIDNVLQNAATDSVIAIYRNPTLPLDTLRIAAKVADQRDVGVRSVFYLDQNGNGFPDIIRVVQGTEKLTASEVQKIQNYISFETERTITIDTVIASAYGFDILLREEVSGVPFTGLYPEEKIFIDRVPGLTGGSEFPATTMNIADSMAPVIIKATYYDNVIPSIRDTLEVVFSEPMADIGHTQPFLLRSKGDLVDYKLRLTQIASRSDTVLFSVTPVTGVKDPQKGDSIHINPEAEVSDAAGVTQDDPDNIRRLLQYYLLYSIKAAAYFDTTGDGLIDVVKVTMDKAPDPSLLGALYETVQLPQHREFTYGKDDFSVTDDGFIIRVRQPADMEPNTSVDSRDSLWVNNTEAPNGSVVKRTAVAIADSMAPVLISVTYVPGTGTGSTRNDSLVAKFSEGVPAPSSNQPFTFYDPVTKSTYSMQVRYVRQNSPSELVFAVQDIIGKEFPESRDSVSINKNAGVRDQKGNIQDSDNRRSELQFKAQKYDYNIISLPNPYDPVQSTIPASVKSYYGIKADRGLVIIAEPASRMAGYVNLSGRITIYDAVGNKVVNQIKGHVAQASKGVAFVWNGTNDKGRYVGAGTYLAVITIEDNQGYKSVQRYKLGIKRTVISESL